MAMSRSALMVIGTLLTVPFAHEPGPDLPGFLPAFGMAEVLTHGITAFLIYSLFVIHARPSLAVLAAGYLFTALIVVPYVMLVPGVFPAIVRAENYPQGAFWVWMIWHAGFPAFVIAYLWMANARPQCSETWQTLARWVLGSAAVAIVLVAITTAVATLGHASLPEFVQGGSYTRFRLSLLAFLIFGLHLVALAWLFRRTHLNSVLDMWLAVALIAALLDTFMSNVAGARYTVGWYVARANSLLSGAVVLFAFLYEIQRLYAAAARGGLSANAMK